MVVGKTLIPILLALAAAPGGVASRDEPKLRWRGENHSLRALPADLPEPARLAVEAWLPFVRAAEFRLDLDDDGRLLLLSPMIGTRYGRNMKLAGQAIDFFDAKLPPPESRIQVSIEPPERPEPEEPEVPVDEGDEPLPEDPEGDEPHPWDDVPWPAEEEEPEEERYEYYTWGAGGVPPDTETIVFLTVHTPLEYATALEFLAEQHPYLAEWAEEAKEQNGFALQQPLVGASFLYAAPGVEEWNPENELVNRLAQLLLLRRFGQQPNWVVYGWAWTLEITLLGSVYCFPYRDEFVWATEHTAWPDMLYDLFRRRAAKPVRAEEFAAWPRGKYLDTPAKISWGVIDYLVRHRGSELPAMLEELRAFRDEHDRELVAGVTWQRRRDYVIPLAEQERIMNAHLGEDIWRDMTRWFRDDRD